MFQFDPGVTLLFTHLDQRNTSPDSQSGECGFESRSGYYEI